MTEVVLIGKITQSTPNMVEIEYPTVTGVNTLRLTRTMIARFERIEGGRVALLVRPDGGTVRGKHITGLVQDQWAPLHVTQEQINIVTAMENHEEIPATDKAKESDEVPVWSLPQEAPTITLVDEDSGAETVVTPDGPFDDMLFSGGRQKKETINWDFEPVRKPAFVMHEEGEQGATVARVNNETGEPIAYHIFNPLYQSNKRPAGAYLGTFSPTYYPMPYRKGYGPILDMAAEKGWPAQVLAWNEGKASAMFIDATSNVDWEKATSHLGDKWTRKGFRNQGDYRIGFAIYNSLDGSSAFKVQAMAMRLQCSNGQVLGDSTTIVNLKHTTNALGNYDFDGLAEKIGQVLEVAAQEIVVAESMKDIQINRDTLEKLMTICQRKKLITKPVVKRDDVGNVTGLDRGYMWRLMRQGWTNPSEPWVAVSAKDQGTLYQVYNILTGALTHKPEWKDGKGSHLKGSTLNYKTMTDRLQTVHKVLGDITKRSINGQSIDEQLENIPMFSQILY